MRPCLSLVGDDGSPYVHVFIHGIANGSPEAYNALVDQIWAARPAGRVYLFHWDSGGDPLQAILRYGGISENAEYLGRRLIQHVAKAKGVGKYPLSLYGHSMGGRILHWALAHNDWERYRIRNVVLMGAAASAHDDDWDECASEISGLLVNVWSRIDRVLPLDPTEIFAGQTPLLGRHARIANLEFQGGHLDYWPNLEFVLQSALGDDFPQFSAMHQADCPYCGMEWEMELGEQICSHRNGGCGLWFELRYDGPYIIENVVRCTTRACGSHVVLFVDDPNAEYECRNCDGSVWGRGVRIPRRRNLTE